MQVTTRPPLRNFEISARIVCGCQPSCFWSTLIVAPELRTRSVLSFARLDLGLDMFVSLILTSNALAFH